MSKHTPGPWHVDAYGPGDFTVAHGEDRAVATTDNDADARLIAEAPAMYEALRLAYARLPQDDYGNHARAEIRAILDRIEG